VGGVFVCVWWGGGRNATLRGNIIDGDWRKVGMEGWGGVVINMEKKISEKHIDKMPTFGK